MFENRARLVVYLEQADLDKFEEKARLSGKTGQEWARELVVAGAEGNHNSGRTGESGEVRVGGKGASTRRGSVGSAVGEASVGGRVAGAGKPCKMCPNCLPGRRIEMKANGKGMVECPECKHRETLT
jgi:hypothetical protein